MQADKELMAIELAESRASGERLAAVMRRVHPIRDSEKIAASAFLVWQLGEATMRLAVSLSPQGRRWDRGGLQADDVARDCGNMEQAANSNNNPQATVREHHGKFIGREESHWLPGRPEARDEG